MSVEDKAARDFIVDLNQRMIVLEDRLDTHALHTLNPIVKVAPAGPFWMPMPTYAKDGDSGMDLRAAVSSSIHMWGASKGIDRLTFPTGIAVEIPEGYEGQVRPRSGLARKYGLTVVNSPGTIDHTYRGEIKICLALIGSQSLLITPGMRIAQLVIAPVAKAITVPSLELGSTDRGADGFGSTGVK